MDAIWIMLKSLWRWLSIFIPIHAVASYYWRRPILALYRNQRKPMQHKTLPMARDRWFVSSWDYYCSWTKHMHWVEATCFPVCVSLGICPSWWELSSIGYTVETISVGSRYIANPRGLVLDTEQLGYSVHGILPPECAITHHWCRSHISESFCF